MVQKRLLDFNFEDSIDNIQDNRSIKKKKNFQTIKEQIGKLYWRSYPYKKQNWGIWLHHMSAFVGKIKPAMAYIIIKYSSHKNDVVFDPFCGIGTIPLEVELLGRIPIGNDLNPYPFAISRAKFTRPPMNELIQWINDQKIEFREEDLEWIEDKFLHFYDVGTLKEISFFRRRIFEDKRWFILGCILGILHGHRPGHLSAISNLVIPYNPRTKPIYKEVKPRIISKIKRMFRDHFPLKTKGLILNEDARNLKSVSENQVDVIVSSPPYFNTLDYVEDNRLRLNFLGYKSDDRKELKSKLIQDRVNYLKNMEKVGKEFNRILKPNGPCILILGDLHLPKKIINTAKEIENIYEDIGFKSHGIIDDWMPENKCLPNKYKRKKLDRILILENTK